MPSPPSAAALLRRCRYVRLVRVGRFDSSRTLDFLADDGQIVGSLDPDPYRSLPNANHRYRYLVPDENLLADFSRQDEHGYYQGVNNQGLPGRSATTGRLPRYSPRQDSSASTWLQAPFPEFTRKKRTSCETGRHRQTTTRSIRQHPPEVPSPAHSDSAVADRRAGCRTVVPTAHDAWFAPLTSIWRAPRPRPPNPQSPPEAAP